MLTTGRIAGLRATEFARLDRTGEAYLDFTGSALYPESLISAHAQRLSSGVFGNPHSENGPSRTSTESIELARHRVLRFLDAPGDEYCVCFAANTTAAIKLVAESYPFSPSRPLVLTADNHNSMNGIREYAARRGAHLAVIPLDDQLRLDDPMSKLEPCTGGLLGFPAQSNFSGVRHSLDLIAEAQGRGYEVLLDAAAFLPTSRLSLRRTPAEFVVFSAYKILGYPTGLGALVARRASLERLERPWFAGGTVEFASVQLGTHMLRPVPESFEDGTPAFLDAASLCDGFDFLDTIDPVCVGSHVAAMTGYMLSRLDDLNVGHGDPAVALYGPRDMAMRGGTIAFNVLADGKAVRFQHVVERAREAGVALRGGCFCNPGAAEAAFGFPFEATRACLDSAAAAFSIDRLADCLGPEVPVGAVRASFGIATNRRDIDRAISLIAALTKA